MNEAHLVKFVTYVISLLLPVSQDTWQVFPFSRKWIQVSHFILQKLVSASAQFAKMTVPLEPVSHLQPESKLFYFCFINLLHKMSSSGDTSVWFGWLIHLYKNKWNALLYWGSHLYVLLWKTETWVGTSRMEVSLWGVTILVISAEEILLKHHQTETLPCNHIRLCEDKWFYCVCFTGGLGQYCQESGWVFWYFYLSERYVAAMV